MCERDWRLLQKDNQAGCNVDLAWNIDNPIPIAPSASDHHNSAEVCTECCTRLATHMNSIAFEQSWQSHPIVAHSLVVAFFDWRIIVADRALVELVSSIDYLACQTPKSDYGSQHQIHQKSHQADPLL